MGLTSPILVEVLAVAAAGLLTGMIWLWPKLAGSGIRAVLARIACLGVLELIVLSLIFVVVNQAADFYSSWSDLLGTDTGSAAIIAGRQDPAEYSASRSLPPVTVTARSVVAVPGRGKLSQTAQLLTVRLHGQLSGLTVTGYVYLPVGYAAAAASPQLPAAVVISDQIGAAAAPGNAQRLAAMTSAQIVTGRLRPLILVVLPAQIGQDQGCLNIPGGAQAATFFSQDLPRAIDSAYRAASPLSRDWAVLADSSGGYCALQLALTNSQIFAAAALPAAGYQAPPGPSEPGGSQQLRAADNLLWLLQHQPMQPVSVLLTGRGRAQQWLTLARPPMHVTAIGVTAGQWPSAPALDWIGSQLSPDAAARS